MTVVDQTDYIFRLGVGERMRWNGRLIKAADVDVFVNGERWTGVQAIELRPTGEVGAAGRIETKPVLAAVRDETVRIMEMRPDSTVRVTIADPDTGSEIRRVELTDCRWSEPGVTYDDGGTKRARLRAEFAADTFSDLTAIE